MGTITPNNDNVETVLSDQVLTSGNYVRGTIDLKDKVGAYLYAAIGRGVTTALTNGVDLLVRPVAGNNAITHPAPTPQSRRSQTAACNRTTLSAGTSPNDTTFGVASATGLAADDFMCLWGTASDPSGLANAAALSALEFVHISKISGTTLTPDAPLRTTQPSGAYVTDGADVFPRIWLEGGCVWEVIFDFGDDSAGGPVAVRALAHTYDHDVTV